MSCVPAGIKKVPADHIFDEDKSARWNREAVVENNARYQDEVDAVILWVLHEQLGWGEKRLRRFYDRFSEDETFERKFNVRHEIQVLGTKFKPMFQSRMFQCFGQCFTNVSA